jgi:hypothetical protein
MKTLKPILLIAVLLLGAAQATAAIAHGGRYYSRPRVGVYIGAPLLFAPFAYPYYRPYYYPPYAYPPAVVVRPEPPPVYIQREPSAPPQRAGAYWYYCPDSQTYYPYVDRCAVPWQRVVPQPPPS